MKYRIAVQLLLSVGCVVVSGLTLGWWALVLWLGVFLYLATTMELVYKGAKATVTSAARASEPPPDRQIHTRRSA